ncbi:MAG: nicotinamidase-related amidase [Gammaproteobacteria bacterium]|jgi:nicotinamidase-related amidase
MNIKSRLIDVDDSVLIAIDIQDGFLDKYDKAISQQLVAKVAWLLKVADALEVPVIAMGEDLDEMGGLNSVVQADLPVGTIVHNKDAFGLAGNLQILDAVIKTGRKTAVLVGMETDVCVSQSALGLINQGFEVVVLKDAIATTEADEEIGLSRIHGAGVVFSSVKALYFEWLQSVSHFKRLKVLVPELEGALKPNSLVL